MQDRLEASGEEQPAPQRRVEERESRRLPDFQRDLLDHLHERIAAGDRYFKSRKLAQATEAPGSSVDRIGRTLADLEESDAHSLVFERFSDTGCITWYITESDDT